MAGYSVTFSQRLMESIWDSINDGDIAENAYDTHIALGKLIAMGNGFKKTDMAGPFVTVNANLKQANITSMISEGGEYTLANVETGNEAQYKWVTAVTPLVFTHEELGENQGKSKILDTVNFKMGVAKKDQMDVLDYQFIRGSGTAPASESLNTLVGTSDSGGLAVATYPQWIGKVDATSQNLSYAVIDKAMDATNFGNFGIDIILSGLTLFQRYKAISTTATTIFQPSDSKSVNSALNGIEFFNVRGAFWYWDRKIQDAGDPLGQGDTANYLYGLNSNELRFCVQKGADMVALPKKDAVTQLAWHIPIITRFQFCTTTRRAHFKLTNVGTS